MNSTVLTHSMQWSLQLFKLAAIIGLVLFQFAAWLAVAWWVLGLVSNSIKDLLIYIYYGNVVSV